MLNKELLNRFTLEWWKTNAWTTTKWLGVTIKKNPFDLMIMQEILVETRPNLLIECGTSAGGSSVFFASILDLLGIDFKIYTIDIASKHSFSKYESRITFLHGSSLDPKIVSQITTKQDDRVAVVLDSLHTYGHVKNELEIWNKFVTPGQYLICEDTVVDVCLGWKHGAHQAVLEFQKEHSEFVPKKSKERLEFTFNYDGYMLRK